MWEFSFVWKSDAVFVANAKIIGGLLTRKYIVYLKKKKSLSFISLKNGELSTVETNLPCKWYIFVNNYLDNMLQKQMLQCVLVSNLFHFVVSCLCSFQSYVHPLKPCQPWLICGFNWQIWSAHYLPTSPGPSVEFCKSGFKEQILSLKHQLNKGSSRVHPRKWIFRHCFDLKTLKFSPLTKKKNVILRGAPPRKK